jgi:SAM-dependent methyltransferase
MSRMPHHKRKVRDNEGAVGFNYDGAAAAAAVSSADADASTQPQQLLKHAANVLRQHHNLIKRELLNAVSSRLVSSVGEWSLLDLGCGRGGDIAKWLHLSHYLRFVVGVDQSVVSISEANRRRQALMMQHRRRLEHQYAQVLRRHRHHRHNRYSRRPWSSDVHEMLPMRSPVVDMPCIVFHQDDVADGRPLVPDCLLPPPAPLLPIIVGRQQQQQQHQEVRKFHAISTMFSLHYLSCASDLTMFFQRLCETYLLPGGYVFGCLPDGNAIRQLTTNNADGGGGRKFRNAAFEIEVFDSTCGGDSHSNSAQMVDAMVSAAGVTSDDAMCAFHLRNTIVDSAAPAAALSLPTKGLDNGGGGGAVDDDEVEDVRSLEWLLTPDDLSRAAQQCHLVPVSLQSHPDLQALLMQPQQHASVTNSFRPPSDSVQPSADWRLATSVYCAFVWQWQPPPTVSSTSTTTATAAAAAAAANVSVK